MEVASLPVKVRSQTGRGKAERLRNEGLVPAVIYGLGKGNLNLALPGREFVRHVYAHHKVFRLDIEGQGQESAYLQELQFDTLTDEILHADFLRIDLDKPMHAVVEIVFVGVAKGQQRNGQFESQVTQLEVECLPSELPETIEVVINDLDLGESIQVRDLQVPAGVKVLSDPDAMVCHVKERAKEVEPTEEEGAEGVEGAEGGEGAAASGEAAPEEGKED